MEDVYSSSSSRGEVEDKLMVAVFLGHSSQEDLVRHFLPFLPKTV